MLFRKIFLGLGGLCLALLVVGLLAAQQAVWQPAAVGLSLSLAIGIGAVPVLKGYQYTAWILAAVVAGMTYPGALLQWGDFDLRNRWMILVVVQLVMFGMGTQMSLQDFSGLARKGRGVLVGVLCQFSVMPLIGFLLTKLFSFDPEIAAGIILIGSCSSGLASNVMVYLAGGNLALSVTLTAVATLLAPLMTPFMMKMLAGTYIEIRFLDMMLQIVKIVIIPIGAGLLYSRFLKGRLKWLDRAMPLVSMSGIVYFTTVTTAAGRDSLLQIGLLLFFAAVIHNTAGYFLGYWLSRALGLDRNSARTVAFEVGLQNGGMASGLAGAMGKLGTVGLAAAVFSPWMNVSGSVLANHWKGRPVKTKAKALAGSGT